MVAEKHTNKKNKEAKQKHAEKNKEKNKEQQNTAGAYNEAQKDIEQDPDLSVHSPNDDLDEGETARLGDNKTDLV